jgi:hypothetical protein
VAIRNISALKKVQIQSVATFSLTVVVALLLLVHTPVVSIAETASDESLISLTLPGDIPFTLVLPSCGADGFVHSETFQITNNGLAPVFVTLENVKVEIDNPESFAIVTKKPLHEQENNLYMMLVCTQNGVSTEYALTAHPKITHTYLIEPGESVHFQFTGTVSQGGELSWDETTKTVFIHFAVKNLNNEIQSKSPVEDDTSGFVGNDENVQSNDESDTAVTTSLPYDEPSQKHDYAEDSDMIEESGSNDTPNDSSDEYDDD